jgi:hypothetical protein
VVEREAELEHPKEDEQEYRHQQGEFNESLAAGAVAHRSQIEARWPPPAHRVGSMRMTFDQLRSMYPTLAPGRKLTRFFSGVTK